MVIYEMDKLSYGKDNIGMEMYYLSLILTTHERVHREGGGVDSTTKGAETRIPVSSFTICPSSGCAHRVYNSSVLTIFAKRLPNKALSRAYSLPIVRRHQQHADDTVSFMEGLVEENEELIDTLGPICRCLRSTRQSCQISFCGLWTSPRRGIVMLKYLGNADWEFTHAISGSATKER